MIKILALALCMLASFGAPVFASEDLLKKEQGVFDMFCAHCHGKHMVNPGTSSFDLRKFPKDEKDRFFNSVNNGRGDMPSWGDILLPDEMDLLWHYVVTRAGKEPAPFGSVQASTEKDNSDTNSAQLANPEEVLEKASGKFNVLCAHCHGKEMVSPGTAAFDLRKFPKEGKDRFYNSVNTGHVDMPAWADILKSEEIDLLWYYVNTRGGTEPASSDAMPEKHGSLLIKPGTLTACLAKNGGVMSSRRAKGGAGMDYELVAALADRMDLALAVEWFESEQEEESTPVREAYALLAYGVCDVYPGFALYETSLSAFFKTRAALPRWVNRPTTLGPEFQVDLEPISVSDPYARMEMGVVYRTPDFERDINQIADMEGLRIGVEEGTLSGILTLRQGTDKMVAEASTFNPGADFLWQMEQGEFDAALVTIGAYDFHKKQNFVSTLSLDEYRHQIGFNLSLAMLKRNRDLLDQIDPLIHEMIDDGSMAKLAKKSKHTYAKPHMPWVQKHLTMQDIIFRR
ncbi:MAG: c-type cytochrome [Rhodobacteraceae bacterium]|nr:c-type cytochrome [Paracoccaceae bacterium]